MKFPGIDQHIPIDIPQTEQIFQQIHSFLHILLSFLHILLIYVPSSHGMYFLQTLLPLWNHTQKMSREILMP